MNNQIVFVNGKSKCGCVMEYSDGGGEYSDVHTITPCAEHSRPEASFLQRIAELERSETQLIGGRDNAEVALADMYQAAMGERPEWSNMFGFADAVDAVEERLGELEANQTTPEGMQFLTEAIGAHGYIVGCLQQNRPDLALEESLKWVQVIGQAADSIKESE